MNTQALQHRSSNAVGDAMTVNELLGQVSLVQDVMRSCMKEGEHYGKIPGCGDKPTLLQPGAQKLLLTFQMAPEYQITQRDLGNGHREYEVKCRLTSIGSQKFIGEGVGACSTMESKWKYRSENTGKPVPQEYWDTRSSDLLGGHSYSARKMKDKWFIFHRVEHDNPADYYNTCLKMAKKRALVDATVTRTAASDIFTQDVEEIEENKKVYGDAPETEQAQQENHARPVERVAQQRHAPPPAIDSNDTDWREVEIHFGKNKGKKLGELAGQQLKWYREEWQPQDFPAGSGKFSDKDLSLRRALDAAGQESTGATSRAITEMRQAVTAATKDEDNVPF